VVFVAVRRELPRTKGWQPVLPSQKPCATMKIACVPWLTRQR